MRTQEDRDAWDARHGNYVIREVPFWYRVRFRIVNVALKTLAWSLMALVLLVPWLLFMGIAWWAYVISGHNLWSIAPILLMEAWTPFTHGWLKNLKRDWKDLFGNTR